jgi:hypothetical protein
VRVTVRETPRWASPLAGGALVLAAAAIVALDGPELLPLVTLAFVFFVFFGLDRHARWGRPARAAYLLALALGSAWFAVPILAVVRDNLADLPEWDYLGFWLHARTAVLGRSFYDPASAQELARPFDVSSAFQHEIVDVGFWYPPPSMFLFWPLGGLDDPAAALPPWLALQAAAAAASIVLAWRISFRDRGAVELAATAALVVALHGTYTTAYFSQTNFVALLALLLYWRARHGFAGGVWIPVAAFVKPFVAAVALAPVLERRWRVVAGMAASGAVLTIAAAIAFGPGAFVDYLTRDQVSAKPSWIYDQPTNQSLLGLVLRATDAACEGSGCVTHPAYLAGAAGLATITLLLGLALVRAGEEEWALSLYLLLALAVYPVSQLFYSVLLLPIVLLVWRRRAEVAGGAPLVAALIAIVWALSAVDWGATTILGFLLLWAAMAAAGVRLARAGGPGRIVRRADAARG